MMAINRMILISTLFLLTLFFLSSTAYTVESKHYGLGAAPQQFKESMKGVEKLGLGIVRIPLHWQLVQPRQDEFNWNITDRMVEAARTKRIEILFTLRSISAWGTKKESKARGIYHTSSAPSDMKKWEQFMTSLASRYHGLGVYYEIENEVNAPAFWDGTVDEYLDLLKTSYKAIKSADPQTKVLPAAMACGVTRNFQRLANDTGASRRHDDSLKAILSTKAFDVVSVHDYYFPSDIVANGFTFRSYLEHIRNLMKETGVGGHETWITEIGYVSRPTDAAGRMDYGSPEKQAKWLVQAYQEAFALGVERIFWLLLRDRSESYFGSMGLVDSGGTPRPACKALVGLTQVNSR